MVDTNKLESLRARYGAGGERGEEQVDDHDFQRALSHAFQTGRRTFPYAGISTLLDAPLRTGRTDAELFADLDVALIGVPFDLGVTNRSGTRLGPRAVRAIERIGPYHHALRVTPLAELRVADVGDVPFSTRYSLDQSIAEIQAFISRAHAAGVRTLCVGGDHSMTLPILRSLGADRPVGLVHIDAHCDTSGALEGTALHHGGPFRNAVLDGVLDPERTIQIGIRGSAEMLYEFSYVSGMTVIHAEDLDVMGLPAVIAKARDVIGNAPFYITFDVDSLDPAFAPGTGTPEIGGLTPREVQHLLRGLRGLPGLIGGDVVEIAPQYDGTTITAQNAAMMMFEMLSLMACNRKGSAT